MKKMSKLMLVGMTMALAVGAVAGCNKSDTIKFNDSFLKNATIELESNDVSLGVLNKSLSKSTTNNKNYLVAFDSNNNSREVKFKQGNKEINQKKLNATINNLFVTNKFTYITFEKNGHDVTNYQSEHFTASSYFFNNWWLKTFVIDNETKKLYPTAELGERFTKIRENYILVDKKGSNGDYTHNKYYELSIDKNSNLIAKQLIKNDYITEDDLSIDKYGQVFISNSDIDRIDDGIFYYTNNKMLLGNDNLMYKFNSTYDNINENITSLQFYKEDFTLNYIPNDTNVWFGGENRYWDKVEYYQNLIITNNEMFYSNSSWSSNLFRLSISEGEITSKKFEPSERYFFLKFGIFKYIEADKTLFNLNLSTDKYEVTIDNISDIVRNRDSMIVTKNSLANQGKYEIKVIGNQVITEQISDTTYDNNILTIQPIN